MSLLRRGILSWLASVLVELFLLPDVFRDLSVTDGLARMSFVRLAVLTVAGVVVLSLIARRNDTARAERLAIAMVFAGLAVISLRASFSWTFFIACLLVEAALVIFCMRTWNSDPEPIIKSGGHDRIFAWITGILAVLLFIFVAVCTVCRIYSFSTPTYDFGIFAQMFYNMKETGLPLTTVERDGVLSHLHVHMSPIWYLLLPFYMLVPIPATLQVLQAAIVASSAIPLWKLTKDRGFSGAERMLLCIITLLAPMLAGGAVHDIHENCFLTPLILWLFYAIERKSIPLVAVFSLLVLTVKEDAAVYVALIALWLIVRSALRFSEKTERSRLVIGAAMLLGAVAYFLAATGFLAKIGDGVMTYRYENFMYGDSSSLLTVIKSVILNPLKALYECVEAEKLEFIALTLLPMLALPFFTRRYERYILLIPYLLVNLMTDYPYQHDIFYQYTFGPAAFLAYLSVVNAADMKQKKIRLSVLITAAAVTVVCFGTTVFTKLKNYPTYCYKFSENYRSISETLSTIPSDAAVCSTTFYTTFLSQREVLYDIGYASRAHLLECEYVVLNLSAESEYRKYADAEMKNGFSNLVALLWDNGYEVYAQLDNVMVIYRKGDK